MSELDVRFLEAMNDLNSIALSKTSVKIRCSDTRVLFAERDNLIAVSDFFRSMLDLKPNKKEAVINLTGFLANEATLTSLVQYANLRGVVPIQWSIRTIAEMIFLVDPLQLTQTTQEYLAEQLSEIMTDQAKVNILVSAVHDVIMKRKPNDTEIEQIIKLLDIACDADECDEERPESQCSDEVHDWSANSYSSLIIFAIWMQSMSSTLCFTELIKALDKFVLSVGSTVPDMLLNCNDQVPGLLFWIKMIYSYEENN